jgi:23S rRNA (guanosine2251-2'-O)-methyltransferase
MREIVLIAHNLRSCHNVGSLLRTAEGLGIQKVYFSGYTPYPVKQNDDRLPHLAQKLDKQISKTALGAEKSMPWEYQVSVEAIIDDLHKARYVVIALEQTSSSKPLPSYITPEKIAILVGREVEGVEPEVLALCDDAVEIPMFGSKESFNVVQAAAMALYKFRFAEQ